MVDRVIDRTIDRVVDRAIDRVIAERSTDGSADRAIDRVIAEILEPRQLPHIQRPTGLSPRCPSTAWLCRAFGGVTGDGVLF